MSKANMPGDDKGHLGSNFSKEEYQTWDRWLKDPNGTKPHRDIGSRSRPMSIAYGGSSTDELWEQMVKRGLVAARDTPEEACRDAVVTGMGVLRVPKPKKPAKRGRK